MVYVSITGLRLKSWRVIGHFWWHAIPSMVQARRAKGNLSASARTINGVRHTVSVWSDRAAMRAYLVEGAHGAAMANFHAFATGHAFGYLTERPPAWNEVHQLWLDADPSRPQRHSASAE